MKDINEVIASKIHELQGFGNYTLYALFEIKKRDYDYGVHPNFLHHKKRNLYQDMRLLHIRKTAE